jgi:hypothetical protein
VRRRLFNLAAAMSLGLCVATVILWVRSIGHTGSVYWIGAEHHLELTNTDGVFGILFARDSRLRPVVEGTDRLFGWFSWRTELTAGRDRARLRTPSFNKWGFGLHLAKTVGRPDGQWRFGARRLLIVYLPYWLPVLAFALPPVPSSFRFLRRRHRMGAGRCPNCGYDLRATPGRCPECGTAVAAKPAEAAA